MADEVRVRVDGRSFGYRGETYTRGDELTVDESTIENHPRTLERVDAEDTDETEDTDASDEEEPASYDRDELEGMEYEDLQTLASEADTDAVDGRSSRDDIVEALSDE